MFQAGSYWVTRHTAAALLLLGCQAGIVKTHVQLCDSDAIMLASDKGIIHATLMRGWLANAAVMHNRAMPQTPADGDCTNHKLSNMPHACK